MTLKYSFKGNLEIESKGLYLQDLKKCQEHEIEVKLRRGNSKRS